MLKVNEIYNGDCLQIMKDIDDNSIDCIICDLPYGTTKNKWDNVIPFEDMWLQYNRIIKDNGAIVLFGTDPFMSKLICSNIKNFKHKWIWDKCMPVGHLVAKFKQMQITEEIAVFSKDGKRVNYYPQMVESDRLIYSSQPPRWNKNRGNFELGISVRCYTDRFPTNLLKISNACRTKKIHPTEKPIELLEYLVKTFSKDGDLILDNCCGSGTTCHACKNLNRNYIGIELTDFYYNISKLRLNDEPYLHLKTKDGL